MKYFPKILFLLFIFAFQIAFSQDESVFNFSVNLNYTTTSKLFPQPFSSDQYIRTKYDELNNAYSYSAELRYKISEEIFAGIGAEYLKKTFTNRNLNLGGIRAETKEGYTFIPIELTIYYVLPFSSEYFKFFMGGGGGLYLGKFIREFGDITTNSKLNKNSFGIHVVIGMEYVFWENLSIRGQMRFRDPEIELKNNYASNLVTYNGTTYLISTQDYFTKVNIDGITFVIGIVYSF